MAEGGSRPERDRAAFTGKWKATDRHCGTEAGASPERDRPGADRRQNGPGKSVFRNRCRNARKAAAAATGEIIFLADPAPMF
ncbi:MAG: hypothetical protein LBR80_05850 [Deltaproteobacteria bacterium]|jgi:hypothetical protein|nr:hypothetical protein [Deltaproteobacteria bacterium]